MKYLLGKADWQDIRAGEEHCFLLTNGLGGYCSQTVIGSNARNDHGLLIAAVKAPSERWTVLRRLDEVLYVNGKAYELASQRYVTQTNDKNGWKYLNRFSLDGLPVWEYMAEGVRVVKKLVMPYGTNSLSVSYEAEVCEGQEAYLEVFPVYSLRPKNEIDSQGYHLTEEVYEKEVIVSAQEEHRLRFLTDGSIVKREENLTGWYFSEQDSVDGRDGCSRGTGLSGAVSEHIRDRGSVHLSLFFDLNDSFRGENGLDTEYLISEELKRQKGIMHNSGLSSPAGQQLAVSSAAFLTRRESTQGMSIMAGFPFFGDWGRDTMIAFYGCTLAIGETEAAKSILKTFMKYCRRGIMPNLFPEGNAEPMYNTVDASLLFINAAYEYLSQHSDDEFAEEVLEVSQSIIEWYAKGTDYNIHMDSDGLLCAGSGLWQLTWMDVRFGEILPTPRHGKPVEINAYWFNAVMIVRELTVRLRGENDESRKLAELAERIRISFLEKFTKPDGTLYDVLTDEDTPQAQKAAGQVRCNEVFALALPYSMISREQAALILAQVRRELYTPVGLRSLSVYDSEFHGVYGGSQFERDMAYHQGTVWGYPLGAYYRACLRYSEEPCREARRIREQLESVEAAMAEGCLGQLPEIYSGADPCRSKGCYAQAWSTAELLRVYKEIERLEEE